MSLWKRNCIFVVSNLQGFFMVSLHQLYSMGVLFAPIFTCFAILLILSIDSWKCSRDEWRVKSKVFMYFVCSFLNWGSLVFYFFYPPVFVYLNWFIFLTFLLVQVYFYAFIFKLTRVNFNERFSYYHYLLPALFSLALLLVSLATPFEGQLQVVMAQGACTNPAYRLFFMVSNSKILVRIGFSMVYVIMAFYRLHRYRKFITDYSANDEKTGLTWLTIYLLWSVGLTSLLIIGFFFGNRAFIITSPMMVVYNALFIFQYGYLSYYILKGQYIPLSEEKEYDEPLIDPVETETVLKKNLLTRERFDEYIQTKKPYLNCDLKITDLVDDLGVNRSYISAFINTEYQMNFNYFINQCRLNEYKRIKEDPAHSKTGRKELSEMAGFSSYKSLNRFSTKCSINN